jgi:hypothetical protein
MPWRILLGHHLIDGEFQSDKYPTTPRGKVPLGVRDEMAQDLLWEYARRRRRVDAEFSDDLEAALRLSGSSPPIKAYRSVGWRCEISVSSDPDDSGGIRSILFHSPESLGLY